MTQMAVIDMASGAVFFPVDAAGYDAPDFAVVEAPEDFASRPYAWDGGALVPDLAILRAALWDQVKARRSAVIDAGVAVAGIGIFDSDEVARANVSGAATAALAALMLDLPFEAGWTLRDNSRVTLTAQQMVTVHVTGVTFIGAVHAHAADLRATIKAATSIATLDAIDIEEGWAS